MFMRKYRRGQAIIEYAIVFSVIIAALLIMQMFIKRGYQGGLKDAADKMGEQFSAGGTTISQERKLNADQTIAEATATTAAISNYDITPDSTMTGLVDQGVYTAQKRTGGESTSETRQATDSAAKEKTRASEYQTTEQTNFAAPF